MRCWSDSAAPSRGYLPWISGMQRRCTGHSPFITRKWRARKAWTRAWSAAVRGGGVVRGPLSPIASSRGDCRKHHDTSADRSTLFLRNSDRNRRRRKRTGCGANWRLWPAVPRGEYACRPGHKAQGSRDVHAMATIETTGPPGFRARNVARVRTPLPGSLPRFPLLGSGAQARRSAWKTGGGR